jgi:hypothetical protein
LDCGDTDPLIDWGFPDSEPSTPPEPSPPTVTTGTDAAAAFGIGVTPTVKLERWTVFGGVFARNHPTTIQKSQGVWNERVEDGPLNVSLHAGAELAISDDVSAIAIVHQNLTADPVRYGPGIAAGLSIALGR